MKIKVLYEDKDILAIDKPSGIAVHADGKTKEKTITDWVLKNYPKMKNVGEPMGEIARPGIVHRLDRETSEPTLPLFPARSKTKGALSKNPLAGVRGISGAILRAEVRAEKCARRKLFTECLNDSEILPRWKCARRPAARIRYGCI
ncbi:MAG: Pseudouridine synthase, RluA family [Candidatus Nomurabacteria bacterium GW2011_GWB1_47_6]|uniref:Pseudouridine synthase, RluA family n=1 Tax=Candidatus Nomurabacteria bacterium GW2011_GWB1_47_6 TaxID=1618749 RepID=A0A0G1T1S4_9BACT|nr:MAG: Pseudouridine synthase, RluA family [Candidatus Nomurabacteria bacterium GW2011_GWB1_47_6]